eukprot:9354801-Prorocentrum_lima.AAC.1
MLTTLVLSRASSITWISKSRPITTKKLLKPDLLNYKHSKTSKASDDYHAIKQQIQWVAQGSGSGIKSNTK